MKKQVRLLDHKTFYPVILEYFPKDKVMKEVVPEMNIINTLFTE